MKIKKQIIKLLTDWKHWFGWIMTTGALVLLFHLLGIHAVHLPFY
ncbi:hypothetical protein LCGC14_1680100, partial [marine sediment metagenome]